MDDMGMPDRVWACEDLDHCKEDMGVEYDGYWYEEEPSYPAVVQYMKVRHHDNIVASLRRELRTCTMERADMLSILGEIVGDADEDRFHRQSIIELARAYVEESET